MIATRSVASSSRSMDQPYHVVLQGEIQNRYRSSLKIYRLATAFHLLKVLPTVFAMIVFWKTECPSPYLNWMGWYIVTVMLINYKYWARTRVVLEPERGNGRVVCYEWVSLVCEVIVLSGGLSLCDKGQDDGTDSCRIMRTWTCVLTYVDGGVNLIMIFLMILLCCTGCLTRVARVPLLYRVLLNIGDQSQPSGMTRGEIDRLPVTIYGAGDGAGVGLMAGAICSVCLDEYTAGEEIRVLNCRHVFHKSCIDNWIMLNRTCPICRAEILAQV